MKLLPETSNIQHKFADYCRTGKMVELPGVNNKTVHHYRRLVYNVVNNTLIQAYPITKKIVTDKEWDEMVQEFFSTHDSKTPQIWKLPFEFYQYAKTNHFGSKYKKPFLNDLLYFEWIEIEVHTMPDKPFPLYTVHDSFENDILAINPEYKIIQLTYPVHLYPVSQAIEMHGNYFLMVYREPETGNVKFMNLSVLHVFILELLSDGKYSTSYIIDRVKKTFKIDNTELLVKNSMQFIKDLKSQEIILGYLNIKLKKS